MKLNQSIAIFTFSLVLFFACAGQEGVRVVTTPKTPTPRVEDFEKMREDFDPAALDDYGSAQTGVILAENLGVPSATIVMEIQKQNDGIKVKRELESGWFQWVELPLPSLLTIQSGINQIRYATIKGIMMAKKKEIKALGLSELGLSGSDVQEGQTGLVFNKIYVPEKTKQTEIFEGDPKEVAQKLADKLKNEAKVI